MGLAGFLDLCPTSVSIPAYPSHRGKHCSTWSYTLIPTNKPGQFTRDNRGSGPGADKENIQVIETDYVKFALVLSLRQVETGR